MTNEIKYKEPHRLKKAEEKNPVGKEGWQDRTAGGLSGTVAGNASRKMVCRQHVARMRNK